MANKRIHVTKTIVDTRFAADTTDVHAFSALVSLTDSKEFEQNFYAVD